MSDLLHVAAVALAALGVCASCLAGIAWDEARTYRSMRRAFLWDAGRNALAGAALFGGALWCACA